MGDARRGWNARVRVGTGTFDSKFACARSAQKFGKICLPGLSDEDLPKENLPL
jgi:hypothetical protein